MEGVINFSGHPVAGTVDGGLVGKNLPVDSPEEIKDIIRQAILTLPNREELLQGKAATVILPGMSLASGLLLAEWSGQFGSLPSIRWAVRGPDGFEWPETARADLNQVRLDAREQR